MMPGGFSSKAGGTRCAGGSISPGAVLTDDELDRTHGKWDQVVGLIEEKAGETAEAIEGQLAEMMS